MLYHQGGPIPLGDPPAADAQARALAAALLTVAADQPPAAAALPPQ
ncbi:MULTISPECIES: hypothetical protein [Nonomuraea]|uniref:Uncharacterized protein n=1 Tax=Nonomuraea mangrovi TaxID=2316207 RepID=A0ABW4SQ72_9ACTN